MNDQSRTKTATGFKSLSHPRRMKIFELLLAVPSQEMSFQSIQIQTRLNTSSLIHHLREMERLHLISRKRKGLQTFYKLQPDALETAIENVQRLLHPQFPQQNAA